MVEFNNNEFLRITMVLMVFLYVTKGDSAGPPSVDCSQLRSCRKCKAQFCYWSMSEQTCEDRLKQDWTILPVRDESYCPHISEITRSAFAPMDFVNVVEISNDRIGFGRFIKNTQIYCCLMRKTSICDKASVYGDKIDCQPGYNLPFNLFSANERQIVFFFYITFNNVKLTFDNYNDHYFTVYDHNCGDATLEDCAVCLWTDNGYMHYLKVCSSRNRCTGLYKYYEKRSADDYEMKIADQEVQVACPDVIRVRTVEPVYASVMGDTKMKIAVVKHRILAENQIVVVTVAGRNCTDPKTEGDETIICTVTGGPLMHESQNAIEGPVKVKYGSSPSFIVTSLETVKFVYPAVTAVRPNYGPLEGGSLLTLSGEFLNVSTTARVSIGNISTCELTGRRSENVITCTTAPARVAAAGLIEVEFDGRYISDHRGPEKKTFEYVDGPRLKPGQRFEGIASGGTNITVRGSNFPSMHTTYYVCVYNNTDRECGPGCDLITQMSMQCQLPKLDWAKTLSTLDPPQLIVRLSTKFSAEQTEFWFRETDLPEFELYPDPVFTEFELKVSDDSPAVLKINGRDLGRGFSIDEVDVRFLQNSCLPCKYNMTMTRNDLLCFPSCSTDVLQNLTQLGIVVTVGGSRSLVLEKPTPPYSDDRAITQNVYHHSHSSPYDDKYGSTSYNPIPQDDEHKYFSHHPTYYDEAHQPSSYHPIPHDDQHSPTPYEDKYGPTFSNPIPHDDEHQHAFHHTTSHDEDIRPTSHHRDPHSTLHDDDSHVTTKNSDFHSNLHLVIWIFSLILITLLFTGGTLLLCSLKKKHRSFTPAATELKSL